MNKIRALLKNGRKIYIKCEVVANVPDSTNSDNTIQAASDRSFKVDSGSQVTCVPASMLDLYISEEEYMKWADQHKTEGIRPFSVVCKGIDSKSAGIKWYTNLNSIQKKENL